MCESEDPDQAEIMTLLATANETMQSRPASKINCHSHVIFFLASSIEHYRAEAEWNQWINGAVTADPRRVSCGVSSTSTGEW